MKRFFQYWLLFPLVFQLSINLWGLSITHSLSLYQDALQLLKISGIKFYTHQLKDHNKFKLVLFGLPQLDLKTITDDLKFVHNVELLSIKEIKTKYSSYDDTVYMIEFNRDQVSKKEIQKIRFFYNTAVK